MNIIKLNFWQKLNYKNKIRIYFENIFNIPIYKMILCKIYFYNSSENLIVLLNKNLYILFNNNINNIVDDIITILSFNNFKSINSIIIKHYDELFNSKVLQGKFNVLRDYKTMYMKIKKCVDNTHPELNDLKIELLDHYDENDINLRLFLQNSIFNNQNLLRKPIDKQYIFREVNHSSFLNDYCYCFKIKDTPIGYGQIIKENSKYYLVNFGILHEYRNNGYGKIFLNFILNDIFNIGEITELYLNVDNNNVSAINLYKSIGFKSTINTIQIKTS